MSVNKYQGKRIQVVFTKEQYEVLEQMVGEMGSSISDVVRNIVLTWLLEKSFITSRLKNKNQVNED